MSACVLDRPRKARILWEKAYGPLPRGAVLMHRCDEPACVNFEHLVVGDSGANQTDMVLKGRGAWRNQTPTAVRNARYRADLYYPHLNLGTRP